MHQNFIEYQHVKSVLPFLVRAELSPHGKVTSLASIKHRRCQGTASEVDGCSLNPRLLLPTKPLESDQDLSSHMK
jgi:hypothetical protein